MQSPGAPPPMQRSGSVSSQRSRRSVASSMALGEPPPLSRVGSVTQRSVMSVHEHYGLSAVDKWMRFRKFPWKLLLHLALTLAITLHLLLLHGRDGGYTRAMRRSFEAFFMPKGIDNGLGGRILFTNEGFLASVRLAVRNYYTLNGAAGSVVSFTYRNESTGELTLTPPPVVMQLELAGDYVDDSFGVPIPRTHLLRSAEDNGPFTDPRLSPADVASLLDVLLHVRLEMGLCNTRVTAAPRLLGSGSSIDDGAHCYCWRIRHHYDFTSGGNVHLHLHQHVEGPCYQKPSLVAFLLDDWNLLNVVVLALASVYLVLLAKAAVASLAVYLRARQSFDRHVRSGLPHPLSDRYHSWAAIPWRVKRRFFSTWLLIILLGVAGALASAVLNLAQGLAYAPSLLWHKATAGLACFLLWTSALRYLEPYPRLYALIPTVNVAVTRLAPFLAGFVPIFVGYALLGMACFGRDTVLFATLPHTLKTLFGMMNGDSLHNIIGAAQASGGAGWVPGLYFFSYIALAIYVVINIIIATTEEAFFISRRVGRKARRYLRRALAQLDEMEKMEYLDEQQRAADADASDSSGSSAGSPSPASSPPRSPRAASPARSHASSTTSASARSSCSEVAAASSSSVFLSLSPARLVSGMVRGEGPAAQPSSSGQWRGPHHYGDADDEDDEDEGENEAERNPYEPAATAAATGRTTRGRSDTLFLLNVHEAAEEEVFRDLITLLLEEYRID